MLALLSAHFAGVTADGFAADLAGKNWAVLVERDGHLVGFSTLAVYEQAVAGERLTVVCSGDTIVSPAAWGSAAFPRAWITAVYQLRRSHPTGRLVWLLLTSGFRTYRLLPVFWRTFHPRYDAPTPPAWQRVLTELATLRFGERFDPAAGIVRFHQPQRLRGPLADVPIGRAADPHVAFFLGRNPGHADGDELVCVADLDPTQLTAAGRRIVYGPGRRASGRVD
jgi:hypothetical protein